MGKVESGDHGTSARVDSVDFLRGIAMMALVLVHSVLYLGTSGDGDVVSLAFAFILGDVGAALFTTLVGMSFVLATRRPMPGRLILIGAAVRGAFLFAVAILLSLVTTGVETIFEWDVLALIAIASVLLVPLRRVPSPWLLAVAAGIVLAAPLVRGAVGYLQWRGGALSPVPGLPPEGVLVHPVDDYLPGLDAGMIPIGLLATGWFPLLPWLAFPVVGLVLGRQLSGDRVRVSRRWLALGAGSLVLGLAAALAARALGGTDPVTGYLTVLSFTPDSTTMVVLQAGLVLIVLGLTHLALDRPGPRGRWMNPIRLVSRYALTVYVVSYVAIFVVIRTLDVVEPARSHIHAVTSSGWALLFGVGFVVLLLPVLALWDRHGGVLSLEWLMGRMGGRGGPRRRAAGRLG
jgi:uncharacterized membrane protein